MDIEVHGTVAPGLERVTVALREVVEAQDGAGACFAAWHDGAWVADVWAGYADVPRTRSWTEDTLVMPYSVTKPFAAVCVLLLVDRGLVELDAPVQDYWPEMTAVTTVREVLAHRSGHVVLDQPMPAEAWQDWSRVCAALAEQRPAWPPGTAQGESALFYGHLLGELVRRVDGRSLGRFLRDEVAGPLAMDFHVGLTTEERRRTADLSGFADTLEQSLTHDCTPLLMAAMSNPAGALDPAVVNSAAWRSCEVPAVNGHGTARAVAGLYVALTSGELLSEALVTEMTRVRPPEVDRVMGGEPRSWGLGVAVEPDGWGMGGTGGSTGWWSTEGPYAAAYLTSHVGDHGPATAVEDAFRAALGLRPL